MCVCVGSVVCVGVDVVNFMCSVSGCITIVHAMIVVGGVGFFIVCIVVVTDIGTDITVATTGSVVVIAVLVCRCCVSADALVV